MKIYILNRRQLVRRPREEVFAFFEKAENLVRITPPKMKFNILTPLPIEMRPGALIDYSVNILGVARHWRTQITDYRPPHKFVDSQLKGPYTFWHHTHIFEETDEGTMITDEVRYVVPFGVFGRLANVLIIRRELEKVFDFRSQVIERVFAARGEE